MAKNIASTFNMAKRPGTYLALIHKPDNTAEFKALRQDSLVPERLVEIQKKGGIDTNGRDSQIYIMPKGSDIELVHGTRMVHYIEGYTQAITATQADNFHKLMMIVEENKIAKGMSLPILLFDIIDVTMSDEALLNECNFRLDKNAGYTTQFTLEDIQNLKKLKKDLLEVHPAVFYECHNAIQHISENSSVVMQNMISRFLYLQAEKNGMGVLGQLLNSNKLTTIIFVLILGIIMIVQST